MAKGNGTTRSVGSSAMYGSGNSAIEGGITASAFDKMVTELSNNEYPEGWYDLEPSQRELALMESGFTGFADDGAENIMFPTTQKDAVDSAVEAVINDFYFGSKANSDTYITIGYKDGTMKSIGSLGSEIETVKPLTKNQSSTTQGNIVKQSLKMKDIAYITHNDAYRETYWIAKGGESQFRKDTGYEYWKKGRGEKRRDYIQDDWI